MLGSQHHECHAERRVRPGGVHAHRVVAARDAQAELGALRAADPVALHRLDPLGPIQFVKGIEQLVRVSRDPEEPLLEVALDDQISASFAGAIRKDLLVGEDRVATRAPVDGSVLAVGQTGFEEPQEDQLVPAHVQGIVAVDLPAPVVAGSEALQAGLELLDAGLGEGAGVATALDGGVLRRQAEAVESDGAEHRVALHGPLPHQQVSEGVVADVALVGGAARVGVHAEDVVRRAGVVVVDLVRAFLSPAPLPFGLHGLGVVRLCHSRTGYRCGAFPPRWLRAGEGSGWLLSQLRGSSIVDGPT